MQTTARTVFITRYLLSSHISRTCAAVLTLSVLLGGCEMDGMTSSNNHPVTETAGSQTVYHAPESAPSDRSLPALVVTNEPPPDVIYRRGSRDTVLADSGAGQSTPRFDNHHVETLVTRKVVELNRELSSVQRDVDSFRDRLQSLQSKSDAQASEYYGLVASINTELQAGTTAGNPVLTERWNEAQAKLESLSSGAGQMNTLATDVAGEASRAAYLQESARATYGLSGAVEEDHKQLQVLEDKVNQNIVTINRLLTSVNDEINRRTSYLRAERLNLQTLSLGIANGELYGQNVSNTLFRKAAEDGQDFLKGNNATGANVPAQRRPLVIIRFDRPDVNYKQALYTAVSQALEKYPAAKFDLVAVSTSEGNPAQLALASTEARKNGEAVLRSLTQMGLPLERIRLNAANSKTVSNSEVHLYIQ